MKTITPQKAQKRHRQPYAVNWDEDKPRETYKRGQKAEWVAFHPHQETSKEEQQRKTADAWELGGYTLLSTKPQGFRTSSKWRLTF